MGGILGRLFREFAVTICTAILISGVVSVTLTPMLCSRFLRRPASAEAVLASTGAWSASSTPCSTATSGACACVLQHRYVDGGRCSSCVLGATVYLFGTVSKGFIPDSDNDSHERHAGRGRRAPRTTRWWTTCSACPRSCARIRTSTRSWPAGRVPVQHSPRFWVQLTPRKERALSAHASDQPSCGPSCRDFPGFRVFMVAPPSIRIGGHMTKSAYDFTLQGPDTDELYQQAPKLERAIAKLPGPAGRHHRSCRSRART